MSSNISPKRRDYRICGNFLRLVGKYAIRRKSSGDFGSDTQPLERISLRAGGIAAYLMLPGRLVLLPLRARSLASQASWNRRGISHSILLTVKFPTTHDTWGGVCPNLDGGWHGSDVR